MYYLLFHIFSGIIQIIKLASDFDIDEIIVAAMTYSQEDRMRSFELLAEIFELKGPTA
jgi:hypothetical protein